MDAKQPHIDTGSISIDPSATEAAAAAVNDMVQTISARGQAIAAAQALTLLPNAVGQLVLPDGVELEDIRVAGRNLVITLPDGTQMIVPDGAVNMPQIVIEDVVIPADNIAALLGSELPEPEVTLRSSGGNFADPVGQIGDPFALGDLLPPTELSFGSVEEPEIFPGLVDREVTTVIVTPDQPAGAVAATSTVDEAALPARNMEPEGSNAASNAETVTGTIQYDAPDGVASITINGISITAIGQVIATPFGNLTITSIAPGAIGYSYTLADNTSGDTTTDNFAVTVTDVDGDSASATLTINIIDDVPTARNDTDGVAAGTYGPETGNVLTGADTTSGAAGADTQGADGATITGFVAGTGTDYTETGNNIAGQYGTLTLNADGSYTYVRNPGTPGGVDDVFTYQLTDGDGDTSTATLTISIADSPAVITFIPSTGAGTIVDEAGLPARGPEPEGSNEPANVETTTGTITYVALDGPATVEINGIEITSTGQMIVTATGILTVTGITPGAIDYSFTLTDNSAGDNVTEVFTITVTDVDGDSATGNLTINIIDDVPTANDDSAMAAEDTPVVINVINNDVQGADGVDLVTGVALNTGPAKGMANYNGDGTFTYIPNPGAEGTDNFTYTITDSDGDTSTATVTITLARDSVPQIAIEGDQDVNEAGLPARGMEPEGSDAASDSEIANGTIFVSTGNDMVTSLVINGVNVTAGGVVNTANGVLTITLNGGNYDYSYVLTDNTFGDATSDNFSVTVTDSDGDVANDTLVIAIIDDVPTANDDTDSIAAGQYGPATGNVITDAEGDGGADVEGADGVTVAGIAAGMDDGTVGVPLQGQYGVLTLNADGSYSYARDAGTPGGVSDIFTYTITDGDGDTSVATLTISIADSGTTLDLPTEGEAGTLVDEAGLPARPGESEGSDEPANSETTAGVINYTAPDGPATVTIGGVAVTSVGQAFVGATGTLTITSIANGSIGYSYTLADNTSGDATSEVFAIVVTDQDGDFSSGNLTINIVDDVPTANADIDRVTEDGPLTADGNVLTGSGGVDVNDSDGVADVQGADSATVTAVSFNGMAGAVDGVTNGAYGTLTLNADGSYSYVLNNALQPVQGLSVGESLSEVFTYEITDGDGDMSTTTLTITINGADDGVVINGLDGQGSELTVDEDDLGDGSSPDAPALTQTNSFTFDAPDGLGTVTIGGQAVYTGGAFVPGVMIASPYGTLTITGFTPVIGADGSVIGGTVNYQYALMDNTLLHSGGNDGSLTDSFNVVVTDTDGSNANASLDVTVIDDTPTANDDSAMAAEDTPVVINVINNDVRGADGVDLATGVALNTGAAKGMVVYNGDGTFTYTPNPGETGNDSFTYIITDGDGDTSIATVTITLAGDSEPRIVSTDNLTVDEDGFAYANVDSNPLQTGPDETDSTESLTDGGSAIVNFGNDVPADLLASIGLVDTPALDGQLTTLDGTPVTFAIEGGTGDLVGSAGGGEVIRIHLTTAVAGPGAGDVTYSYTTILSQPVMHVDDESENSATLTGVTFSVTDSDGDSTSGSFNVSIVDDVPTANDDSAQFVAEDAVGTIGGNVMTNDVEGADGAALTSVSIGGMTTAIAAIGTTQVVTANGTYVFDATGAWTFDPNSNLDNASGVDASFSYTITDGDGDMDSATQPITVTDGAGPSASAPISLLLDDQNLADGSTPAGPDSDADDIVFTAGSDTIASIAFSTDLSGLIGGLTWTRISDTQIVGKDGAVTIVTLDLNIVGTTATVTATLNDNYDSHPGINADDLANLGSVGVVATDIDGDTATGTVSVSVSDDVPTAMDDGVMTIEGAPAINGNVITNDTVGADMPGTITAVTGGTVGNPIATSHGTLTLNSNGTYTYTPNASVPSGSVDSFTYTLTDADGDMSTAVLSFTFDGDANLPTAGVANASVDDDALPGGNPASTTGDLPDGNADGDNDQATFSGILPHSFGLDGPGVVSFAALNGTSGMVGTEMVNYSWNAGNSTLTATGPRGTLFTVEVNQATGDYTVTLLDNVLHTDGNNENDANVTLGYTVSDSDGSVANGTLNILFDDDMPSANPEMEMISEVGEDLNTAFVLDFSGSIDNGELNVMLGAVKAAITELFNGTSGSVTVRFVLFSSTATASMAFSSAADAIAYVESVNPADGGTRPMSGGTSFTAAVQTLMANYTADDTANNQVFFLSDGNPNQQQGSGGTSIYDPIAAQWFDFVNDNGINVTTIGIGNGINIARLQDVDVDGQGAPILVNNFSDVIDALLASLPSPTVSGDLDANDAYGADGGHILSITIPTAGTDPVYTWNGVTGAGSEITISTGGMINGTTMINVATEIGGELSFDFATGQWSYKGPANVDSDTLETFTYVLVDGDNDTVSSTLQILVKDNQPPATSPVTATVDDDALSGGIPGGTGDIDANVGEAVPSASEAIYNGLLGVTATDSPITAISFAQLHGTSIMVGTESAALSWDNGTDTLTATGPRGVLFTVQITDMVTGAYTVTLVDNVLHANGGNENDANVALTYVVNDSDGSSANGTLNILFDDDTPTATSEAAMVLEAGEDLNAAFVLDFSGSIDNGELNVMLDAVKAAVTELFNGTSGSVAARFILFSSTATASMEFASAADAITYIESINPADGGTRPMSGNTNFTAAIQSVMANYAADASANNQVFFLSDGNPNQQLGSGGASLSNSVAAQWFDFINDNDINVTAIGIGNNINIARLQDVDVDGEGTPILVNSFDDVIDALLASLPAPTVSGDLDANDAYGADGGHILSITIPTAGTDPVYTWNGVTGAGSVITISTGGAINGTTMINVATEIGGKLDFNFATGEWTYKSPGNINADKTETFTYVLVDGDNDTATANLQILVKDNGSATSTTMVAPVALDLDGNGLAFLSAAAGVTFDYDGDGVAEHTAWVGPNDGLLAIDLNGDGIVNDGSELVFARDGMTDLQALAADYDSNGDGKLTAEDSAFAQFGVWQDANSNGVTDAGEFHLLSEMDIVSIDLDSDGITYTTADGDVDVLGQSVFTRGDGSTGLVGDVAFATGGAGVVRNDDSQRGTGMNSALIAASLVALGHESALAGDHVVQKDNPDASGDGPILTDQGSEIAEMRPVEQNGNPDYLADRPDRDDNISDGHNGSRDNPDSDDVHNIVQADPNDNSDNPYSDPNPSDNDGDEPVVRDTMDVDQTMQAMLDMGAHGDSHMGDPAPAGNPDAEAVVRDAMLEGQVEKLLDAMTEGDWTVANDNSGSHPDAGLLANVLNQNIDHPDMGAAFADFGDHMAQMQEMAASHS